MGFFDTIKSKFGEGKIKKEQIQRLRLTIKTAISDGVVSEQELAQIDTFYFDSGLNQEEFQQLKSEAFMDIVQNAIADRRVTEFESNVLERISKQFEILPDVVNTAKQKVQYFELFAQLESGIDLPVGDAGNLILQKNESAHLSLPAVLVEERVVSRQYTGNSRGISVPIVKGIRFNVGAQRGSSHSIRDSVIVSQGYFVITSKRLVFSGDKKSVSSDLSKLLDLQVYADALQFSVTNRQKPITIRFEIPEQVELCGLIISRLVNES
jgi:hypothetical protein